MPQYGLCLRVTHTGKAGDSVHISDIRDGVDLLASFRKAGPVYVPHPDKGGFAVLVYSGDVAVSFESGGIRKFIEGGYLTAEFVVGSTLDDVLGTPLSVLDESVLLTAAASSLDFVGAGVTATTVGNDVTVTIPGGGAGGNHAALSNLDWLLSLHTGATNTISGFDGVGAARYYGIGTDLQAWDSDLDALAALATTGVLIRTGVGSYVTRTLLGTAGNIVVTNGDGVLGAPIFDIGPNVVTTASATSGDVSGTLPGPLTVTDLTIAGEVQGDILYFNGSNWVRLAPGVNGEVLTTQGAASNPLWSGAGSTTLLWGSNSVASSTTTRYLFPGFDNGLSQTAVVQIASPRAGTLRNLRILARVGKGNGNSIVYTVRINGIPTALTVNMASTATSGSDLVNTVAVAAGDLLDIAVTKAASVGSSPIDVTATVEFL